eukprot:8935751-Heterocapsa_arctica.AAC.1
MGSGQHEEGAGGQGRGDDQGEDESEAGTDRHVRGAGRCQGLSGRIGDKGMVCGANGGEHVCEQWGSGLMEAGPKRREVPMDGKDRQMHQGGESDEAELRELCGEGSCGMGEAQLD